MISRLPSFDSICPQSIDQFAWLPRITFGCRVSQRFAQRDRPAKMRKPNYNLIELIYGNTAPRKEETMRLRLICCYCCCCRRRLRAAQLDPLKSERSANNNNSNNNDAPGNNNTGSAAASPRRSKNNNNAAPASQACLFR